MQGSPGVSRPIVNGRVTTPRSDFWPFPDQLQLRDRAGFSPASKRRSRAFYVRKKPLHDKISEADGALARRLFRAWPRPERSHRRCPFALLAQARSSLEGCSPEEGSADVRRCLARRRVRVAFQIGIQLAGEPIQHAKKRHRDSSLRCQLMRRAQDRFYLQLTTCFHVLEH